MTQMLFSKLVWTGFGVDSFRNEVNSYLAVGWTVASLQMEKRGLRTLCVALLQAEEEEDYEEPDEPVDPPMPQLWQAPSEPEDDVRPLACDCPVVGCGRGRPHGA